MFIIRTMSSETLISNDEFPWSQVPEISKVPEISEAKRKELSETSFPKGINDPEIVACMYAQYKRENPRSTKSIQVWRNDCMSLYKTIVSTPQQHGDVLYITI